MPIDTDKFFEAVTLLVEDKNMRITIEQSGKGTLICSGTTFIGGLLLGPVGLAVGGTAGGLAAYQMTKGSFKSVAAIIQELSSEERERLKENIVKAVQEIQPGDIAMILSLMLNNANIQEAVLRTVATFIKDELKLQIVG